MNITPLHFILIQAWGFRSELLLEICALLDGSEGLGPGTSACTFPHYTVRPCGLPVCLSPYEIG